MRDPALHIILRLSLSLLFLWAAGHKLRDRGGFRAALARYALLPPSWVAPCAVGLVAVEMSVVIGLWLPGYRPVAGFVAAGLLALYAAAIGVNLIRGRRDIDCGCTAAGTKRPLGVALVLRNGVLLLAAVMLTLPSTARPLAWLDAVTVTAGVAALVLLYAAVDGLLANAPKLALFAGEPVRTRSAEQWHA